MGLRNVKEMIQRGMLVIVKRSSNSGRGPSRTFWQRGLVTEVTEKKLTVKFSMGTATRDQIEEVDRLKSEWRRWVPGERDAY